jgi:hypothetical protein
MKPRPEPKAGAVLQPRRPAIALDPQDQNKEQGEN